MMVRPSFSHPLAVFDARRLKEPRKRDIVHVSEQVEVAPVDACGKNLCAYHIIQFFPLADKVSSEWQIGPISLSVQS